MTDEEQRMELPTKYRNNILRDRTLFQAQLKEVFDKQELWFFAIRSQDRGPKFEFCNKKCLENNLIRLIFSHTQSKWQGLIIVTSRQDTSTQIALYPFMFSNKRLEKFLKISKQLLTKVNCIVSKTDIVKESKYGVVIGFMVQPRFDW